jgi:Ca-activated chloride channel family protein
MARSVLGSTRRRALLSAALLFASLAALALSPATLARQQGSRPRRATAAAQPAPTPTPARAPVPAAQQSQTPAQGRPQQPAPAASPTPPGIKGQEIDPEEVLTVDTNLVNLHVRVIDRNNRPVDDVPKEEFRVFEDGAPQKIEFFSREEVPISYGLVVDNSRSMHLLLKQVTDAAKTIVNENKPGDETFLMRFVDSENIKLLRDFTTNKDDLDDALDDMYTEGGQTAVIDAVYLAAEHVAQYKKTDSSGDRRRRAMILVTDGEDRSSYYKLEQLFYSLRENDVQIYVIGFTSELDTDHGFIRKSPKEKAVDLINKLAAETGGRAFFPNSITELPGIANEITKDLRTQYVVGYYPTNSRRDGTFRSIKVQIADTGKRDHRIAITRAGRLAGPPAPAPRPAAPSGTGDNSQSPRRP